MVDDIENALVTKHHPIKYYPTEIELQDLLLIELEKILSKNATSINNYSLPQLSTRYSIGENNHFIEEELTYDTDYLEENANKMYFQLTEDQIWPICNFTLQIKSKTSE